MARHARKKRKRIIIITSAFASLVAVSALGLASHGMYEHEGNGIAEVTRPSSESAASRGSTRDTIAERNVDWGGIEEVHITYSQSTDEKQAVSALRKAADDGRSSLDKSNGKVDDANTRTKLQQVVDDANNALQGMNDEKEIDIAAFDAKTRSISNAVDAVNASMDSWNLKQTANNRADAGSSSSNLGRTVPAGEMQQWFHDYLLANGYTEADFSAGVWIINHESGWNVHATNPSSGAYGLAQALPGSKMASAGSDWHDNYQTQLKWFIGYCTSRYGGIQNAYNFWVKNHWY